MFQRQKPALFTAFTLIALFIVSGVYLNVTSISNPEITYNRRQAVSLKTIRERSIAQNRRAPAFCDPSQRGLSVVIEENEVAYLDESTNIDTLTINGELHCDNAHAANIIELKVKTIIVNGTFQCGTKLNPYGKKLIISLKDSGLDPKLNHGHRGIIVEMGGKLNLNGNRKNAGWYKLNQTINPGDQSINVDFGLAADAQLRSASPYLSALPWKVGEQIVIGPTGFNYAEAETFTITNINQNQIFLDHPVQFTHWGEHQVFHSRVLGAFDLDERAEVANLTRSILIRADESQAVIDEGNTASAQIGGHIMVHLGGQAYIDSIELFKMGQAGIMGRYPFHWHWAADVNGQYIKNSSIHHSFQRCVTVHRTHSALVQNNVCYDFKGHGYFLEDGNEINNKIIGNLAIMAKGPSSTKLLLASDDIAHSEGQGRFPSVSGFWISNPKNIVKYNVVSGSIGTGFWMAFEEQVKDATGTTVVATPIKETTLEFNYNTAHAAKVGITWDGAPGWENANNPNNPNDKKPTSAHYEPPNVPTFVGLKAYKNYLSGIYFRGQSVIYRNTIVADNGWSFWVSYNQIIKDSVFIGQTQNNSPAIDSDYYQKSVSTGRLRKTAIVLYDGPFEIHHSDFMDFSTQTETYTLTNGSQVNSTIIPFTSTGGTNKFTNRVSGLHFDPEPVHRIHNYSASESPGSRFLLGNAVIRDVDGTLAGSGIPSVITGVRSLGVTSQSHCTDGGTSHYQYKICPSAYTEGSFNFMRWNSMIGAWATPFVVKRSDGALNYQISEWSGFPFLNNNTFAIVNNQTYSYELLPYYSYETDRMEPNPNFSPALDSNYEIGNANPPVVKIVAYGNNCRLEDGAIQVQSLAALKLQTVTSYFTQGKDFYVRLIPKNKWAVIADSPLVTATAYTTMPTRHRMRCDNGALPYEVLGNINSVIKGATNTVINGWACNFTHASAIKVKLYAIGPAIATRQVASAPININTVTFLGEMMSTQASDANVAFKCGKLTPNGRAFSFSIPNSTLAPFTNHKIYVKGISNTGGADIYINGSGNHYVIPRLPVINSAN